MAKVDARANRVIVLLCTHNGGRMLEPQLRSISNQSRPPDMVLVHDWGSSDTTLEQLAHWQKETQELFEVQVFRHQQAPGPARSFVQALADTLDRKLQFDWVLLCDQDDLWRQDKIAEFVACADQNPGLKLIHCDYELINEAGDRIGRSLCGSRRFDGRGASTLVVSVVPGMCMALSRNFLTESRSLWGGVDWYMHDWAFCICAHVLDAPVAYIDKILVGYRQHNSNIQGLRQWWVIGELLRRIQRARDFTILTHRQLSQLQGCSTSFIVPNKFDVVTSVLRDGLLPRLLVLAVAIRLAMHWPRNRV
ncbi:rhamnosyltransferase [Inhella inkyongensis]|uniref:Rhamnosyltransferase n=1 Tax=Inhella inkyongensis TaxID=392593 RepID=A0A840S1P6_9BURK|nr:glycosyltransferase [Inhella inkyongensis]MBB5202784.1 rhamnosyltransferase [Inhella inkyongensis]